MQYSLHCFTNIHVVVDYMLNFTTVEFKVLLTTVKCSSHFFFAQINDIA